MRAFSLARRLLQQGGRDTAHQRHPGHAIELSWEKVGGFPRWFHAKKPGRSTTDNRGLARSVPALNLGPSLQMVRTRERSPLWTSSSNLNLIAATQGGRNTSSNCIPATPIDAFVGGDYSPTLAGCEQARTLDDAIMRASLVMFRLEAADLAPIRLPASCNLQLARNPAGATGWIAERKETRAWRKV